MKKATVLKSLLLGLAAAVFLAVQPTLAQDVNLPVTFDDGDIDYALTDFGGNTSEIVEDPTDATNMVAKSVKGGAAETWAGTTIGGTVGFATPIPFENGSTTMKVRVWSPTANTPLSVLRHKLILL